jgi:chromosome segregation ATPase
MEADFDDLVARIETVERAITDGERDLSGVADAAARADRLDELEETLTALDERVAELEATAQSLRGYLGGVQSVNEDVERRANAALAKAEALEADSDDDALVAERVTPADAARRAMNEADAPATARGGDRATDRTERGDAAGRTAQTAADAARTTATDPARTTTAARESARTADADAAGLAERLRSML